MAKVIITIEDVEGKEDAININYAFDPEIPNPTEESQTDEKFMLSPAQTMAMHIHNFMQRAALVSDEETSTEAEGSAEEEGCAQTGEKACCGGDCHTATAEA